MPRQLLSRIVSSAWFAYLLIFTLQLKRVWGMWEYKDMATGDTTSYLSTAKNWAVHGIGTIVWSPLYTLFYSAFLHLTQDLYLATIAHRLVIVLVLPLLILTVMRRLLHPWVAWGMTAWWVVLPINFDALYEVHLFALVPVLLAVVAAGIEGPWGRGMCCAVLLTAAVLMRNEIGIPFLLFASACLYYEFWAGRQAGERRKTVPSAAYAVPILIAVALMLGFYWRGSEKGPNLQAALDRKHTLNVCQVYAFGYQQRNPEWVKSPWVDCQELMQTTFGSKEPTLREAFVRNPKAIIEHVLWNISLTPSGLQVLLFNAMSGTVNPDYAGVMRLPLYAALLSILTIALLTAGVLKARRQWSTFYPQRIQPNIWTWLAMFCVAAVMPAVIATQRPRPSYLFALSVVILSLIGMSLELVIGPRLLKRFEWAWPALAVAVVIGFRPYYPPIPSDDYRPLLRLYRNLTPYKAKMGPGAVVVTPGFGGELCNYFAEPSKPACTGLYYYGWAPLTSETALNNLLTGNHAQLFYVNPAMLREPPVSAFVEHAADFGWRQIGGAPELDSRWLLLEHGAR